MSYVYLIYNTKTEKYYIGRTNNLKDRVYRHKKGLNKSTKFKCSYWNLVYVEIYVSEKDARQREQKLKAHGKALVEIKKRCENSVQKIRSKIGEGER